mmetsp:Transcript_88624/g.255584  ORF Transcript_88624/g.255584 Transcript_88624/m.255584 type:complete len:245 (+) Transcript_88624:99-833(+)
MASKSPKENAPAASDGPSEPSAKRQKPEATELGPIVKFNVGGRIFEVLREPTLSLHPNSLLNSLAEEHTGDDPIFVEANPDLFQYMLDFLRHRKISIPRTVSKAAVQQEAAKLGLPGIQGEDIKQDPGRLADLTSLHKRLTQAHAERCKRNQGEFLADGAIAHILENPMALGLVGDGAVANQLVKHGCAGITEQIVASMLSSLVVRCRYHEVIKEWCESQGYELSCVKSGNGNSVLQIKLAGAM